MKIRIQSISDIITNSSSETFSILNGDSIDNVKKIIDSILALAGHGFHWDDFFEIEEAYDETDAFEVYKYHYWPRYYEQEEFIEPSKKELDRFVHDWNSNIADSDDHLIDTYIRFKSIDPDSIEATQLLGCINSLFWHDSRYNG